MTTVPTLALSGHAVVFHGVLISHQSLLGASNVEVWIRPHGHLPYSYAGSVKTSWTTQGGPHGDFGVAIAPYVTSDVLFRYVGGRNVTDSSAGPFVITVRTAVSAKVAATTVTYGSLDRISGSVLPKGAGQVIYLQRYYSGAWRTIVTSKTSSTSTYAFSFHPARGRWNYRVWKPAYGPSALAGGSSAIPITAS
jgi:hypothetical protein